MSAESGHRIPTNLRTLLILEAFGRHAEARLPAAVGRDIGLPKQTVHRLCTTLQEEGFLSRDENGGGLRPGRRARELAAGILFASTSHIARHQVLMELAEKVGETVNFVVPEDQGMSYKDRVETNWAFRIQLPVGTHVPFHCTASGKTFLASLPKGERRRLVNVMRLDAKTRNTITDPEALLTELQQVVRARICSRQRGVHGRHGCNGCAGKGSGRPLCGLGCLSRTGAAGFGATGDHAGRMICGLRRKDWGRSCLTDPVRCCPANG